MNNQEQKKPLTVDNKAPQGSNWQRSLATLALIALPMVAQADYYLDGVLVKEGTEPAATASEPAASEPVASEPAKEPKRKFKPTPVDPVTEFESAVTYKGPYRADEIEPIAKARAEEPSETLYDINIVVVTGDRDPVLALENWSSYENDAIYEPMSQADIKAFSQRILKDLQDEGYLFATVDVYQPSLQLGFLKLRVHVGDKGEVRVSGNKNYKAEQILDKLNWKTGGKLNYSELYEDLYSVNINSHLNVEPELKARVDENGKRVVDIDLKVEEKFPLHLAWKLTNDGIRESSDWRSRLTAQWYNFTKADDLLTIQWTTDPARVHQVNAGAVSYYRPINKKWATIFYGGGSSSDFEDVIPQLDVVSSGWFFGVNMQRKLKETDESEWKATFGWLFQHSEREQIIKSGLNANQQNFAQVNLDVSTPRAQLSYASKVKDKFGGRNFSSLTASFVESGLLGNSADLASSQRNPGSVTSAIITNFQFARLQDLFGDREGKQKWQLFALFDGQYASGPIPSVFYKRIGGMNTVRGYVESVAFGDWGYHSQVELRTPIFSNFFPGMTRTEQELKDLPEDKEVNRLQFLVFYDSGYTDYRDPLATSGQIDNIFLHSVGLGARLGLTKYSQMSFDYGLNLNTSNASDSDGAIHFSFQLQR